MRLPRLTNQFMRIVQFGRYVIARLRRVGHNALAQDAEAATSGVLVAGRALEDAGGPIHDAMACRDLAEDALKDAVRNLRLALLSRGQDATEQPTYTLIFPDGINYYTSAALNEVVLRYQELRSRVTGALSDDDAARIEVVERIDAGIAQYTLTVKEMNDAKNAVAIARTRCDVARKQWDDAMLKVYASLLPEHGKKGAERFFPKVQKQKKGRKPEKGEIATTGKTVSPPDSPNGKTPDSPNGKTPDSPNGKAPDSPNGNVPDKPENGTSGGAPREPAANGKGQRGNDATETPPSESAA